MGWVWEYVSAIFLKVLIRVKKVFIQTKTYKMISLKACCIGGDNYLPPDNKQIPRRKKSGSFEAIHSLSRLHVPEQMEI